MEEVLDVPASISTAAVVLLTSLALAVGAELGRRTFEQGLRRAGATFGAALLRALRWWLFFLFAVPGLLIALGLVLAPNYRSLALTAAGWVISLTLALGLVRALTESIRYFMERNGVGNVTILRNVTLAFYALIALANILQLLGISLAPLLTVIAGSSVGLAFALREPLANLFAGIQMLASDRVRPGHFVRLSGGQEGVVTDIHWADTYIRHPANNLVIVPNSKMTQEIVVNFDRPESELSFSLDFGISYDSDLDLVERVTVEEANAVMNEVAGGVPGFECSVSYSAIADYAIRMSVFLRAATFSDQFRLRHTLIKRLIRRYRQEGIVIPFPTQTIQSPDLTLLDGSASPDAGNPNAE
jgi:small-conductance mechanosensitive channel